MTNSHLLPGPGLGAPSERRRLTCWLGAASLFSAPALLFLPNGFSVFGLLLVVATLALPRSIAGAWRQHRTPLALLALLAAAVLALTMTSMHWAGQGWTTIDNPSRFLLLPWCALIAVAMAPSRFWLWIGAIAGITTAFCFAVWEISTGTDRAGGVSNPIVFANAVLALLAIVIYCRPSGRRAEVLYAVVGASLLALVAIVLSGSRGVLPGLALLLLVASAGSGRERRWLRLGLPLGFIGLLLVLLVTVPELAALTRLRDIPANLADYTRGVVDTSVGTRLEFLAMSVQALVEHPWTGVGIDRFHTLVARMPECSGKEAQICTLGHAHNDIAQWSATMGLGGLAAVLALYAVPSLIFARLIRSGRGQRLTGAAWAGAMVVLMVFISGLTQSVFSHALTTTLYAVLAGLLLGVALVEAGDRTPEPAAADGAPSQSETQGQADNQRPG
ncbi:MAG TPA: O-antigen ligase family protein [Pseudoxanthomonas sp.]|nr:O-antigen ligase family protein [Pseudoxanthomonas sp.]